MEYWKRTIPAQSKIPLTHPHPNPLPDGEGERREGRGKDEGKSQIPLSLYPEACDECHKEQYKGWQESLHSKAVGPGLLSQLDLQNDPETAVSCYYCHAPMMEQSEVIFPSPLAGEGQGEGIKNSFFDNKLKLSGVSCSVCHLREGRIYGTPLKSVSSLPLHAVSRGHHSPVI